MKKIISSLLIAVFMILAVQQNVSAETIASSAKWKVVTDTRPGAPLSASVNPKISMKMRTIYYREKCSAMTDTTNREVTLRCLNKHMIDAKNRTVTEFVFNNIGTVNWLVREYADTVDYRLLGYSDSCDYFTATGVIENYL